jgi:hypothetical protein
MDWSDHATEPRTTIGILIKRHVAFPVLCDTRRREHNKNREEGGTYHRMRLLARCVLHIDNLVHTAIQRFIHLAQVLTATSFAAFEERA